MRSLNKVLLTGNLAADPEVRSTASGKNLATFPLATDSVWKDANGERQSRTDYHRVVAWQGLGETCAKNLKKGSAIYVEGKLHNHSYEDKEKKRRYVTEITADEVRFIRIKKSKEGEKVEFEEKEEMAVA